MNKIKFEPIRVGRDQFYKQINNKVNPLNACQSTAMATCLAYLTRNNRPMRIRLAYELDKMLLRFNRHALSMVDSIENGDYFNTVYDQASAFVKDYKIKKKTSITLVKLIFDRLDDVIYVICLHGDVWKPSPLSSSNFTGYFPIEYASVRDKFLRHLGQKIGVVLHDYRSTYTFKELIIMHQILGKEVILLASVKLYGFHHVTAIQLLSDKSIVIYDPYGHPSSTVARKHGAFNEVLSGRIMSRYLNAKHVKCHVMYLHEARKESSFKEFKREK